MVTHIHIEKTTEIIGDHFLKIQLFTLRFKHVENVSSQHMASVRMPLLYRSVQIAHSHSKRFLKIYSK